MFPSGEALTLSGTGSGNLGAIDKINGSGTLSQNITFLSSATFNIPTAGNNLTLAGNLILPTVGSIVFTGAGNAEVVNSFGNGNTVSTAQNTLQETWYPGQRSNDNLPENGSVGQGNVGNTESPTAGIGYFTLTPTDTTLLNTNTPLSFNTGQMVTRSEAGPGGAATTTAMNSFGSQFGAVWYGQITVGGTSPIPAGFVSFGTGSDDGSVVYVDTNQDGVFEPNELLINNGNGHGVAQRAIRN